MLGLGLSRRKLLFGGFLALFLMFLSAAVVPSGETWAENKEGDYFTITVTKYVTENILKSDGTGTYENTRTEGPETVTIKYVEEDGGNPTFAINDGTEAAVLGDNGNDIEFRRAYPTTAQFDQYGNYIEAQPLRLIIIKNYCIAGCDNKSMPVDWPSDNSFETFRNAVKNKIDEEDNTNGFWAENGKHRWKFEISDVVSSNNETSSNSTSGNTSSITSSNVDCNSSGAMNTIGWFLCPSIEFLGESAETLYNNFVAPTLQVNPKLFTGFSNGSSGTVGNPTKEAWEMFRNIANVFFIIFLLVIIFSQLTGMGIDNYGIKKSLPKLIVAALFVNLSYWICVALVDVSNILGNSLQAMFNGWAAQVKLDTSATIGGIGFGGIATGTVTFVGVIAVLLVSVWQVAEKTVPGVGVLMVTAVITVVIAVLFLFLLLAAREAAIVILTMLSPLAFICYMLPNTKKIFTRWMEMMKGLLLVYPICGVMIGGGNFVSKVLLAAGAGSSSLFSAFAAVAVGAVPVFFVPTVLKQAFVAMGNLGAKISGLGKTAGSRLSKGAGNAIKGTNRFKNHQEGVELKRQERAANRTISRYNKRIGKGKNVSQAQMRAAARASGALDKMEKENLAANTILTRREYSDKTEAEVQADWSDAYDAGDQKRLDALTNVLLSQYGSGGANFIGNELSKKKMHNQDGTVNQKAVASMSALRENLQNNSTNSQLMINKASDAYQMISSGGVTGRNESTGELEYSNLDHFSANNAISTSNGDWATQSGATLQRAIDSGALTTEQIESILNSSDPSIQSGLQSDPKKRDVLQAALQNAQTGMNQNVSTAASAYRATQRSVEQSAQTARQQLEQQNAQNLQEINDFLHNKK